ncbi:hypothetical protein IGI04_003942 [Brassica rapa subsp. trilocularis]|uniref:Uncharacterized protein n=1 Tax=Brassica rapa subsp. trilocularis TaxID=1813537 RepID=A0ABQ7NZU7_BRACM|nr:hypothetical protein IGI04_003942 [Brassica rapa subsp. trilocularis]
MVHPASAKTNELIQALAFMNQSSNSLWSRIAVRKCSRSKFREGRCKINQRMQEQAAENGIIPHLMLFVMSDSPLKQYALPPLCGGYSIAICLDNYNRKVEQALLKNDAIHKLVNFFQSCPGRLFVHILIEELREGQSSGGQVLVADGNIFPQSTSHQQSLKD